LHARSLHPDPKPGNVLFLSSYLLVKISHLQEKHP
jgi:hypothetical protein